MELTPLDDVRLIFELFLAVNNQITDKMQNII